MTQGYKFPPGPCPLCGELTAYHITFEASAETVKRLGMPDDGKKFAMDCHCCPSCFKRYGVQRVCELAEERMLAKPPDDGEDADEIIPF
jgi:hypothetical protein